MPGNRSYKLYCVSTTNIKDWGVFRMKSLALRNLAQRYCILAVLCVSLIAILRTTALAGACYYMNCNDFEQLLACASINAARIDCFSRCSDSCFWGEYGCNQAYNTAADNVVLNCQNSYNPSDPNYNSLVESCINQANENLANTRSGCLEEVARNCSSCNAGCENMDICYCDPNP